MGFVDFVRFPPSFKIVLLSLQPLQGLSGTYLPMQNLLKMLSRICSVTSSPVTSPSAMIADRMSMVQKSIGRFCATLSFAFISASWALTRASACRSFTAQEMPPDAN